MRVWFSRGFVSKLYPFLAKPRYCRSSRVHFPHTSLRRSHDKNMPSWFNAKETPEEVNFGDTPSNVVRYVNAITVRPTSARYKSHLSRCCVPFVLFDRPVDSTVGVVQFLPDLYRDVSATLIFDNETVSTLTLLWPTLGT